MHWPAGAPEAEFPPLLVICGPTATGKTALSLQLAEQLPGAEVISADSRQVFIGMDIGTAKVSTADRARVAHHGIDLVTPTEPFSAADYRRVAMEALHSIAARRGLALLVGGTGLYLRAVARGLVLENTGADPQVRAAFEARLAAEGASALSTELQRVAPLVAAATDLSNPRRVVRALERVAVQGDRLPPPPLGYPGQSAWIGLSLERAEHTRAIGERARQQFESGLIEEAAALRASYPETLPAFSALGYREAFAVLDGVLTRDQAIERTVSRTRQFARRQETWFRNEPEVNWLDAAAQPLAPALARAEALLAGD